MLFRILAHQFCLNSQPIHLNNILHVPQIYKNLLRVAKLTRDNNVYMEFHPYVCYVKDSQGRKLLRGTLYDDLYRLQTPSPHSRSSTPSIFLGEHISLVGWHRRLSHPNKALLRRLLSNFRLPISSSEFPTVCEPCQLGKSRCLPFYHSHVSSSSPFQLIYSDVWGPSPVSSINGSSYFVLFIDDCTKFIWVYFMSHKSQVFQLFA